MKMTLAIWNRLPEEVQAELNHLRPQGLPGPIVRLPGAEPAVPKLERDEHSVFENWLLSHGYAYRHSRTDKATRETCGAPDFTVYDKAAMRLFKPAMGACLAIEFKLYGNKLSEVQEQWSLNYGAVVHIVATAQQAIELVQTHFGD